MHCKNPYFKNFRSEGLEYRLPMPCGHCYACRVKNASVWSLRMQLEATQWEQPLFVTLTYNDEHLPENRSLVRSHCQDFFKLLRYYIGGYKIKYWICGEYGEKTQRPHYHAIIFGLKPEHHKFIFNAWKGRGGIEILPAYTGSFYYVAGYVTKKLGLVREWKAKNPDRQAPFMQCSKGFGLNFMMSLPHYVESLDIGGRRFAIGRYLKNKLAEKFGISALVKNKGLEILYDSVVETLSLFQAKDPIAFEEACVSSPFPEKTAYFWRYSREIELYELKREKQRIRDYEHLQREKEHLYQRTNQRYYRTG